MPDADTEISRQGQPGLGLTAAGNAAGDPGARSPRRDLLIDMQSPRGTMQKETGGVFSACPLSLIHISYVSVFQFTQTLKQSLRLFYETTLVVSFSLCS